MKRIRGHFWTVFPHVRDLVRSRRPAVPGVAWSAPVDDAGLGRSVQLTGVWYDVPGAREAYVVVHGLGGRPDGLFTRQAAAQLAARGVSVLCLALRGADRQGQDLYHAGLAVDVETALDCPELVGFSHLHLLGFSMGGHVALHAARRPDPRLRSVTAICSPLELVELQQFNDRPSQAFYRQQILGGLKDIYRHFVLARPDLAPVPWSEMRKVDRIGTFDEIAVCPRFGFDGIGDYYRSVAIGTRLAEIPVPTLLVYARPDPIVPAHLVDAALPPGLDHVTVRWADSGGHMGFPRRTDLGFGRDLGVIPQVRTWAMRALPVLSN